MAKTSHRVAIVGAGLAGLAAGRRLRDSGWDVTVFDKGRGPGGRSSLRRRDGFEFDHGAQYFTARSAQFLGLVEKWLDDGIVDHWNPRLWVFEQQSCSPSDSSTKRYVGVPAMNVLGRSLSEGLDVRQAIRVGAITASSTTGNARWSVSDDEQRLLGHFDTVLVTAPPAQAAPLLQPAKGLASEIGATPMVPCWAVLVGFDSALDVELDAAFVNHGPIRWIARNTSKPLRSGGEAWVIHASDVWSIQNQERQRDAVVELLCRELERLMARSGQEEIPGIKSVHAHLWRYARPRDECSVGCMFDDDLQLGAAGDWCMGGRIEGAYLSGCALAERVIASTSGPYLARP